MCSHLASCSTKCSPASVPFRSTTPVTIAAEQRTLPARIADAPAPLVDLALRALAVDPLTRPTAREMSSALRSWRLAPIAADAPTAAVTTVTPLVATNRPTRGRLAGVATAVLAVIGVLVVALVALAAVAPVSTPSSPSLPAAVAAVPTATPTPTTTATPAPVVPASQPKSTPQPTTAPQPVSPPAPNPPAGQHPPAPRHHAHRHHHHGHHHRQTITVATTISLEGRAISAAARPFCFDAGQDVVGVGGIAIGAWSADQMVVALDAVVGA